MRNMRMRIKGADGRFKTVYESHFDPKTGNLVRRVWELRNRDRFSLIEEDEDLCTQFRSQFPHRHRSFCSPSPEMVDISITNQCNFECPYCYQCSTKDAEHGEHNLVEKVIKGFQHPPYQIAIGGGEPTLHPDLPDMLRTARRLKVVPNYTTNGSFMTRELVEATNKYCGGVAMTYHPHKGIAWFRKHYLRLKNSLTCQLNVHLILKRGILRDLRALMGLQKEAGPISLVLLAYDPQGRGTMSQLPSRSDFNDRLPQLLITAQNQGMHIAFSEGLLPYFLSRPQIAANAGLGTRSEGLFSCYVNSQGQMFESSFEAAPCAGDFQKPTVFENTSQELWENLYVGYNADFPPCSTCKGKSRCAPRAVTFGYLLCAHSEIHKLPHCERPAEGVKTAFERLLEEDD